MKITPKEVKCDLGQKVELCLEDNFDVGFKTGKVKTTVSYVEWA